ncbi:MAG TPA: hypothetical protein DDY04_02625 [Bacteroidales bacterium]|nr:hypothetical protein [Bacteroidales bacterium]
MHAKTTDYNCGVAKYNTNYIQVISLDSITDNLTAIRKHVYEDGIINFKELLFALSSNFGRS